MEHGFKADISLCFKMKFSLGKNDAVSRKKQRLKGIKSHFLLIK